MSNAFSILLGAIRKNLRRQNSASVVRGESEQRESDFVKLEDRVLFSAVPIDLDVDFEPASNDQLADFSSPDNSIHGNLLDGNLLDVATVNDLDSHQLDIHDLGWLDEAIDTSDDTATLTTSAPTALIIIDERVDDRDTLVAGVDGENVEILVLSEHHDGVQQISDLLGSLSGLDSIHIVAHGRDGGVQLGSTWLTSETLQGHSGTIAQWNHSLNSEADLLFYGCNLASSAAGEALIDSLAALCDCDVAASDDVTGHGQGTAHAGRVGRRKSTGHRRARSTSFASGDDVAFVQQRLDHAIVTNGKRDGGRVRAAVAIRDGVGQRGVDGFARRHVAEVKAVVAELHAAVGMQRDLAAI